jgi:hypothetical protein
MVLYFPKDVEDVLTLDSELQRDPIRVFEAKTSMLHTVPDTL